MKDDKYPWKSVTAECSNLVKYTQNAGKIDKTNGRKGQKHGKIHMRKT